MYKAAAVMFEHFLSVLATRSPLRLLSCLPLYSLFPLFSIMLYPLAFSPALVVFRSLCNSSVLVYLSVYPVSPRWLRFLT